VPTDAITFKLAGEKVTALAERALLWKKTLFVADVHFGKDATFRHAQRWIPPGTTQDDLARLDNLIERHRAKTLFILGDTFHSKHSGEDATLDAIRKWRHHTSIEVRMIKGNHDLRATEIAEVAGFEVSEEGLQLGPWTLNHHPTTSSTGYALCGHLHPEATVRGLARQSLRVPCFWAGERQCVLPAFGGFTGGSKVRPKPGDHVFLVVEDSLIDASKPIS
jgi:DNA ligase-associated metallophosphoesterase